MRHYATPQVFSWHHYRHGAADDAGASRGPPRIVRKSV